MLAGGRSVTCRHEADDDQGNGDQGKDDPRDHAGSVASNDFKLARSELPKSLPKLW
jgi:hypothetical protein